MSSTCTDSRLLVSHECTSSISSMSAALAGRQDADEAAAELVRRVRLCAPDAAQDGARPGAT